MMDNITAYKTWAPEDDLWSKWAKPVLFARPPYRNHRLDIPYLSWASKIENKTAVILDLPGILGIAEGLALAREGFRPVPLYNGTASPGNVIPLIDVQEIVSGLYQGAEILPELKLRRNAPPAFLLDSNRMQGKKKSTGKFDNRWAVFPQDFPSATFLLEHGIQKILLHCAAPLKDDLKHVLFRYQEKGLAIYRCLENGVIRKETISKPGKFRSIFYRIGVLMGLTRNAAGGFGGVIPMPSERTYGHG